MTVISVDKLFHRYAEREALRGISFEVSQGELFGLVGPNGGGKSTTFKILSSLLKIQQGTVKVLGRDLSKEAGHIRGDLGVLFQSPAVDKKLTLYENMLCQGSLYGLKKGKIEERTQELLTRLGLWERRDEKTESLSGGLKRRLEIAKALIHEPKILILDEPTTGLDPKARHEFWGYLNEVRKRRALTVLLTTHLLDEADQCDRVALLNEGKIVACEKPEVLKASVGGDVIRLTTPNATDLIPRLHESFREDIGSVLLVKPTLEDFFLKETGKEYSV